MYKIFFIIILLTNENCSASDYLKSPPDFLPSCQIYNNLNFVQCSTHSIQQLFTKLKTGIPGLKTLGGIDPFHITKLRLEQDNNRLASFNADLTKMNIYGMGDTIVKQSKISSKDFSWQTKFLIPKIRIESEYKLDGRILFVSLKGNGKLQLDIDKVDVTMHTTTKLYEKGGFTFYNVSNVRVDIGIKGLKSKLTNLFNGSEELGQSVNALFNENWKDFYIALKPILTEAIQETLLDILQKVFHYIPANFLITDIPTSIELYG